MMDSGYSVYSAFDVEKHKRKYINYLEVMIHPDGTVHYAVPSHQEYAIRRGCEKLGITRDELCALTPQEFYFDWMTWLLGLSGDMAVWNGQYECADPSKAQYATLRKLKMAGLYKGPLPERKTA